MSLQALIKVKLSTCSRSYPATRKRFIAWLFIATSGVKRTTGTLAIRSYPFVPLQRQKKYVEISCAYPRHLIALTTNLVWFSLVNTGEIARSSGLLFSLLSLRKMSQDHTVHQCLGDSNRFFKGEPLQHTRSV